MKGVWKIWQVQVLVGILLAIIATVTLGAVPNTSQLFMAISENDINKVETLIKSGVNINARRDDGSTGLMLASEQRNAEITKLLIRAGADVNAKSNDGTSALMLAADYLERWISSGPERQISYSARLSIIHALIKAGANLNARDNRGWTPLLRAVNQGGDDVVMILLSKGADVNLRSNDGTTAIIRAVSQRGGGSDKAVQLLLANHADVNIRNNDGLTPLMLAVDAKKVQMLLDAGARINDRSNDGSTALIQALEDGNFNVVKSLLDAGADVKPQRNDGFSAQNADEIYRRATDGAFCICNEPDAFQGISDAFTSEQIKQLSVILTDSYQDKRRPIDRLAPENKQANAVGQVYSDANGFGTGTIVEGDDLMLTVAHVSGPVGSKVEFRVGQTSAGSKSRWAAVTTGVVIATGRDPIEWSLVRLKDKVGKQFGKMNFEPFKTKRELVMAGAHGKLSFYGYPGFKDPRYLWSQDNVHGLSGKNQVHATSSSADSGKPLVYHKPNGEWVLAEVAKQADVVIVIGVYAFDSGNTTVVGLGVPEASDPTDSGSLRHSLDEAKAGRL